MMNGQDMIEQISALLYTGVFSVSNWGGVLFPLILETVILSQIRIPAYGLRFVPVYGEYYFYSRLVPEKERLNIVHIILKVLFTISGLALLMSAMFLLGSYLLDVDSDMLTVILLISMGLAIPCMIADTIVLIFINMDLSERFSYGRYLGILFALFPLIRDICCLINNKKYNISTEDQDVSESTDYLCSSCHNAYLQIISRDNMYIRYRCPSCGMEFQQQAF